MVLAGDTDLKETFVVSSRYLYAWNIANYVHNSSRISWVQLEKKTKEVHHDWILTIQVISFVVKNVSDPVV